ncbi:hypothetical protein BGZ95_001260 [Linnemannia exigua]|uniref:Uncharacterized protein n=1 Tax=Linnemannia exigua TaxID=604196 RepID=A0AAD4D743_9FUNG|nr:hypothetical protein BGZ95_001260 [Linnemannia exigua]
MGGALSPSSAVSGGGVEMEATGSGTSITGSGRPSSPSPGSFRNLSSKLAANTIRKLSISQKSLFSSSKEDLLVGSNSCQCCQENGNFSREDLNDLTGNEPSSRATAGAVGCCCCVNQHGAGGFGDGSVCSGDGNSSATPGNSGSSKGLKMPNKLSLRGPSSTGSGGGSRSRKDKNKTRRKSREMEYNFSSQFVREEFAQYNYERQIEDFQRAARVFKEQKALTTAAAAASIAAEARAAIAEAAQAAAAEAAKNKKQQSSLGQVGMGMGMDLNFPGLGLGLGSGFGFDAMNFDPMSEISSTGELGTTTHHSSKDFSAIDVRSAVISHERSDATEVFEDIPLRDMTFSLPLSRHGNDSTIKVQEDIHSLKGRPSNVSQDMRGGVIGALAGDTAKHGDQTRTGRSVHSVCSVDTVSQQISARHHQHSRLANLSNVASLHSQSQALYSSCETAVGSGASGCAAVGGGSSLGAGIGGGPGSSAYQSVTSNILENSPIQVVRATVGTVDDTSLPCFTFRMWTLSTIFVVMGAAIAEYNFFRSNSAYFSIYFVQLASYFCGKAMARWLPTRVFELSIPGLSWVMERRRQNNGGSNIVMDATDEGEVGIHSDNSASSGNGGRRVGSNVTGGPIRGTDRNGPGRSNIPSTKTGFGSGLGVSDNNNSQQRRKPFSWRFTLNPGKFNMKEHMLIGVAAAAGCTPAYATNVLAIQDLVFSLPLGSLTGIGLVVSSQLIGFSMAWLLFDYVIKPSVMIWPATLVNVSLYNTLHEHKVLTRWFTRMQLFWYAFFAVFLYQWLPRMFMPVLTSMALLCWINPSNNVLRKLGSGYMGLGMGCISLDWSIISGVGPLFTPWWAQCNFFVGLILMLWIITPIVYFTDYWSAMSYPIVSSNLFDNTSQLYDVSKIVNTDLSFNITMYESYSPIIMTPYFAITYGTSFMAVIATFVHVALYYGYDIWLIARTRFSRRATRVQESTFIQSLMILFGKGSQYESGQETYQSKTTGSASVTDLGHSYIGLDGSSPLGRRNSESVSFRNEMVDGGAGMGGGAIAGLGSADDRRSFTQSSHYRQLSQQQHYQSQLQDTLFTSGLGQTTSGCPSTSRSRQGAKTCVDDRDQIPTEMFGTEDIHTALMRAYPEIPGWWFGILFVICFTMAVFVCITTEIRLPVYALILALVLAAVFTIPMAIIQALSSSQVGLNVLSEVVCGYLLRKSRSACFPQTFDIVLPIFKLEH